MKKYILLTAVVLASSMASADDIILVADPWCPYNCGWNMDYRRDVWAIHGSIQFIKAGYREPLAVNAYNMDYNGLKAKNAIDHLSKTSTLVSH